MRSMILAGLLFLGCGLGSAEAQIVVTPPFGGGGGITPPATGPFAWSFSFPYYPSGPGMSGQVIFPGFPAYDTPRARRTIYPAIPLPPREVLEARLAGEDDNRARLTIQVPAANAKVWLDGTLMTQTGLIREFITPTLNPKSEYTFQIRVEWQDDGGKQSRTRKVNLTAGSNRSLTIR